MPNNKTIREECDGYESFHCWDIENPHRCASCCYCGERVKTIREEEIADILGLEVDPEGNPNMLLTYDEDGKVLEGVDFNDEVKELVDLLTSHTTQRLIQELQEIEDMVEEKRKSIELSKPSLRQYDNRDSSPFFCTLCGMDETKISDNKEGEKYFCHCSYWSDPHNAYIDKSGGKWLGWKDKERAKKIIEEYPTEDNGYNKALADTLSALKEKKDKLN